jgi:predicted nuclease with TOPRIM domain
LERIQQLEAEKRRLEDTLEKLPRDEAFKEELDDIKSEIRLLKSQKARLRGSLGGITLHSILPF